MTMSESVRTVLSKYVTFSGRSSRSEFWWWVLATILATIVAELLDWAIFGGGNWGPISGLLNLLILLPNLAVGIRRLHDIDRTGWWMLIGLIPIIGWLVLLYFYIQPGTPGANRFG